MKIKSILKKNDNIANEVKMTLVYEKKNFQDFFLKFS